MQLAARRSVLSQQLIFSTAKFSRDIRPRSLLFGKPVRHRSSSPQRPSSVVLSPDMGAGTTDSSARQQFLGKAWNFLAGASGVFLFPYVTMYLAQRGLSSAQIGLLAALRPWLSAPISMAASATADNYKIHTKLLLAACAAGVMLRSSMPLTDSVGLLFGVLLVGELLGSPVGVLGDSTVLSNCKDAGDYGKQRQWASIGWGLCSLPAGWLITKAGINSAFLVYGLASIPLLYVASQMRYNYQPPASSASSAAAAGVDALQDTPAAAPAGAGAAEQHAAPGDAPGSLRQLLLTAPVLVFLWRCLLMGFGMGCMSTYEFLYLKQLGAPETLMGLALVLNVVTEVPAFALQGEVLKRISAPALLNAVLGVTALRLACYGVLPAAGTPWAVLPVELLHGVTFGLGFCTATVYGSQVAPKHLSATMQGLWQATYAGIGAGLGGLVGGMLMDKYGGQGMFMTAAAIVAAGGLAGAVAEQAVGIVRNVKQQQQQQDGLGGKSQEKSL